MHDLHVFADVGEDGGLDEIALFAVALAAGFDLGAFLFAGVDVSDLELVSFSSHRGGRGLIVFLPHDAVKLELGDLRALEGVRTEGIAHDVLLRPLLEFLDELVVDVFLDIDSGAGTAALSVVEEDAEVDPRDGVINICVFENDVGALAAELEGNFLEIRAGGGFHYLAAHDGAAGEGDLIDVHVSGERGTGDLAEPGEDVDDTWREAGLLD